MNQEILQLIFNAFVQALVLLVVTLLPALFGLLGGWLVKLIKQSQTTLDDRLAAMAVAWAEDKLGAGKGGEKLEIAIEKLSELSGGRIKYEQAELLIRSAYQSLMGSLAPLKNA